MQGEGEGGDSHHSKFASRLYSVLIPVKQSASDSAKHPNLRNGLLAFNRYESTAAATDSSLPPEEKFEYQAEVSALQLEIVLHSNSSSGLNFVSFHLFIWVVL